MYATAQRVYARRAEVVAVNASLYLHGDESIDWTRPNIELIADAQPGRPAIVVDELPPGGNEVLSYLDVAARDETGAEMIRVALDDFERGAAARPGAATAIIGGVALRFWCTQSLEGDRTSEYVDLRRRVKALVERASSPTPGPNQMRATSGLVVEVQRDELGTRYVLSSESADVVRSMHDTEWRRPRIRIDDAVRATFERLHGSLYAHLPPLLTGLPETQIAQLGVARFVDMVTGETQATWPESDTSDERG